MVSPAFGLSTPLPAVMICLVTPILTSWLRQKVACMVWSSVGCSEEKVCVITRVREWRKRVVAAVVVAGVFELMFLTNPGTVSLVPFSNYLSSCITVVACNMLTCCLCTCTIHHCFDSRSDGCPRSVCSHDKGCYPFARILTMRASYNLSETCH